MIWLVFLFFGYAYATCLYDGEMEDGVCSCVGGYSGRHCQIQPYGTPCNASDRDNFVKLQNLGANDQAQVGVKTLDVCNGTNFPCYYRPGLPASNKCLPQFGVDCPDNFSVNMSATCEDGCHPDVFQGFCCAEHAKCEDRGCEDTKGQDTDIERLVYNVDSKGYVITHTEVGACRYDAWYFDKVPLYKTIDAVLEHCQTFVGFGDYGYVCFQTRYFCTGTPRVCRYFKSDPVVHRASCDETKWWLTWVNWADTYDDESSSSVTRQVKTYTATEVQVSLAEYYSSLDSDGDECCNYEKVCEDYNSDCIFPLKNLGSNSSQDGTEPSECCEPKKWRCDLSGHSCNPGFMVNTEKCGRQCNASFATTATGTLSYTQLTSGSAICTGDEQSGITSVSGCFDRCKNDYTHFYMDGNCFCADDLTARCAKHGCDSWCPQGITREYLFGYIYATVCKGTTACPSGWFEHSSYPGNCIKGDYSSYGDGCKYQCYIPGVYGNPGCDLCCDPKLLNTYVVGASVIRTASTCCDIDTDVTLNPCLDSECPALYRKIDDFDTALYTNHTRDCCEWIPDNNYCWGITCESGSHPKRDSNTSLYCEGECENSDCCDLNDHYCDTFTCPDYYRKFNRTKTTYQPVTEYFTTTGDCQINDTCVTSPNYPNEYSNNQACTITALVSGLLTVEAFDTESCCDKLQVGGTAYDSGGTLYKGTSGPVGVSLAPVDKMFWRSDGSSARSGWKVCLPQTVQEVITIQDPYCNGTCDNLDCCAHNTGFCDSQPCTGNNISTGVDRCNGTCAYGDCCVAGEPCDTTYVCNSGNIIDTDYRCKNMENGVCAQAEYSGTEGCCKTSKECSTFDGYSSSYGAYNYDIGVRVGKDIPGCGIRSGYYIRYKTGYILSKIEWTTPAFQDICCQYFQECKGNNVVGCPSGQYNLGDYSHTSSHHLYCSNQGTGDQNCTTDHQSICCEPETCERARTRTGGGKIAWSCNSSHSFIADPDGNIGSVLQSETEFRDKCCSLPPPLAGAESQPYEVVWGNKFIARTTNGLSLWNSAGAREFDGDYSIYGKSSVEALYYNGNTLYTVEDIWDGSSWKEGIVKYDLSTPAFAVTGDCVAHAHYVTTPNFPANYPSNSNCQITALRSGKGIFSRIRIGTDSTLTLPDGTSLNSSNAAASSANRYLLAPTQITKNEEFTWITSPHYTSYGFQLMMVEEFYVLPFTISDWVDTYGRYRVKVMDNVIVYYEPSGGNIYIGSLGVNGVTQITSRVIDSGDRNYNAKFYVDIQKSGSNYLVAIAHEKSCSSWTCTGDGVTSYVWFYKVSGGSASLMAYLRNYNKNSGDDYNFHNVGCSPDATKCYAVSFWRDYSDGDYKYLLTKYTVDLSASSVTLVNPGAVDLGYSCGNPPLAISNTYVAYVCYSQVYVYAHGSGVPTSVVNPIAGNPKFIKFSPDGSKLLLSFSSDQGSDQYMKVYKIPDGTCIVGPDPECTNSL